MKVLAAANYITIEGFLHQSPGALKENCAIGGGSQAVSPLTHMNRHKQQRRRKNQNRNRKQTSNKKNNEN
jgi:hypothetical protein